MIFHGIYEQIIITLDSYMICLEDVISDTNTMRILYTQILTCKACISAFEVKYLYASSSYIHKLGEIITATLAYSKFLMHHV